ncbi:MAG: hypothetical protein AB7P07_00570 [Hyphomonadaceae bacterium]
MTRLWQAILVGGLIAGVLDILYAFAVYGPLSYGLSPLGVLHSVAAGWIGRDAARAGGWEAGALGLATHFGIALIMAAAYGFAARVWPVLTRRAVLWGLVYGLILYVAMNYVVVPLSAAGAARDFPADAAEALARLADSFSEIRPRYDAAFPWMIPGTILTHTLLVGLPIALAAKRFTDAD